MKAEPVKTFFEDVKQYVGFDEASSATLQAFHPVARPHFAAIVDDFYATIEAHPGASAVISGGTPQIERLKGALILWLEKLLQGPHDEAYFALRSRIGRMHVVIDLPQAYMFTAMDRIRLRLKELVQETYAGDLETMRRVSRAVHQILDLELAIMLETYREDLLAKMTTKERLATIGQLSAGIGHELRNPLGVIESSTFILRRQAAAQAVQDPSVARHLDKINVAVQRSNKIITDLLALARNQPPRRRRSPAAPIVATAVEIAGLGADIALTVDVPADVTLDADADQLAQVLSNLLINAAQAMQGRGRIWVEAQRTDGETTIRVRDDGPGVPAEVRTRIFEALFTTKAQGTGLGLALARRVAAGHGGSIQLEPSDTGAVFSVMIPDSTRQGDAP